MFVAYLDESSDQKEEIVFAVGAFIGRNEKWTAIEWRWKQLLREYGIKYYHAVEAENVSGEFDRPPFRATPGKLTSKESKQIQQIRERFLSLACNGTLAGIVMGIDMKDFKAFTAAPAILDKFGGTPYYYGYHLAMLTVVDLIKKEGRSRELVAFICDQHQKYSPTMLAVHSDLQKNNLHWRSQIGSLTYESKNRFIGLQVADCLAYEGRRHLQELATNSSAKERANLSKFKKSHSLAKIALCRRACLEEHINNARKTQTS